jgi:DNA-binding MarR family transcriptional regulator
MLARVGQVRETLMTSEAGTTAPVTSAEFVDLLTLAQRAVTRELGVVLQEESVTVDQWRVLRALRGEQGRSMGELAAALEIPQPTLTRLVDGLAETANLYRTQSARDRRRVSVHLSARGNELLARLDALVAGYEASLRARCGDTAFQSVVTALRMFRDRLT